MAATAERLALDALGPAGAYHAHERQTITDVAGNPLADLSLVPRLFVTRAMAALHKADTLPVDDRLAALARAGEAHATETVAGVSAADHQLMVSRAAGMPISVVRSAGEAIARSAAQAYRSVQQARPVGAVNHWRDPFTRTGRGVWTRRGDVFAVHAPGNHPGVHGLWLEALALGYRVAVRPSRRDPFTPHRLISALRAAGFGDDQVMLLPTGYDAADAILREADLAMAYGGEDVMRKYAAMSKMLPQGPGRSKILVTADVDWREHLDVIVDSISHEGGRACVNTTAVFVEGDPTPVAQAIAERLAAIPSLPPEDERAVLPVLPVADARPIERYLLATAEGTTPWLGGDGVVDELGDGSAVLRPAVHQLDRPDAAQAGVELAFPCVWVAPWTPEAGLEPFKETLVLTAITHDTRLVDALVAEPTISNVYVGDHPTYWIEPGIPHDGYLAEFLMRTKAVIRD
ncbi:MAG TPA: aldehyde dehydrogenase family protein [Baekduia sp.]|uniref:aldehyde dehydrogenase family protein n=1 Tax=Baekduia sp. TaxID=2600305 RepID=UPI002D0A5352|nr:aldehyde dehydrogenase family protein [Baekduia sp.]HMJ36277.1 aldehyde dehydrogenase family protein [Baekduia sp.]